MTPDLFAGSQLVMVGRYRNGGRTTITLSGTVNDRNASIVYPGNNFTEEGGVDFIPRLWATRAIGSYLTDIRLHGEDQELVDSIVALSIRYGIITPYTSFLIQEDGIFSESGREAISRYVQEELAAEASAPSSESSAIQKAAFQGEMAAAEAPLLGPFILSPTTDADGGLSEAVKAGEVIKQVGSKTFVLRNDTWTDTSFDGTKMETIEVEFLSDEYFDLIIESPVLGDYFALGERVIVVYEGNAYEVGEI
jgi:Ca-activated chloride channel family protein